MRVRIVVHTGATEEGSFQPGDCPDLREGTAEEWIKRGWAVPQPDLEEKQQKAKPVEPPEEVAIIETPEDHSGLTTRETAIIKRKKK